MHGSSSPLHHTHEVAADLVDHPGLPERAEDASGDGLGPTDCPDSPGLLLLPPPSPTAFLRGHRPATTFTAMDLDSEVARDVWIEWEEDWGEEVLRTGGRECVESLGGPGLSVAADSDDVERAGKEVKVGKGAKGKGEGDGPNHSAARFVEYAQVQMGIAADQLKPTALIRICELDALLHAFEDAGVVRMSTRAALAGLRAGGGGISPVETDRWQTVDAVWDASRGEVGRQGHSISAGERTRAEAAVQESESIFGFTRMSVDDISQFNEGVRNMVEIDSNRCWHANGRPTIHKPTGIVYELFRQVLCAGAGGDGDRRRRIVSAAERCVCVRELCSFRPRRHLCMVCVQVK